MAKQAEERPQGLAQPAPASSQSPLYDVIRGHVLRALGRPPNLLAVQVHHLWGDQYRVNVLVGQDATSVTIPHSYFISADSHGTFFASQPTIIREYSVIKPASGPG